MFISSSYYCSVGWARLYNTSSRQHSRNNVTIVENIQWTTPPTDWICLNTDAVVSQVSDVGSIGVLRNHEGSHFLSFFKYIGVTTVLQTELWEILEGLRVVKSNNFDHILVPLDNADAIKLLFPPPSPPHSPFPLVRSITLLCEEDRRLEFTRVPREANMVADYLSKLDSSSDSMAYDSSSLLLVCLIYYKKTVLDLPMLGLGVSNVLALALFLF
ncbi:hypothetical protein F3Y22_tig00117005pilonHSYRG00392 [Hibiscus syriacus]|uniref:RNase H type-1 domain-containing protein n=1 Tax=Hibiscus syriacus TaxID=106335 RepID=A0A6A2XD06_HIBSY|nr:hypothetical protein F3Y22_tig00117005pilonHSYRG00392 [Hibiscus syriacus]